MARGATTAAPGAKNGQQYLDSLVDAREVWLNGECVDVTQHAAFAGLRGELARLYDLQHSPEHRDAMVYASPLTGNPVSYSYLAPTTMDELLAKRRNTEVWSRESWGQLARAPDFMANVMVGIYDSRGELAEANPTFAANAVRYYEYCRENDIALTHSIVDPQIDRMSNPGEDSDLALRVIKETDAGVVVRGAKQLATLAPLANEILVYLSATFARRDQQEFVSWFALPMDTEGLKILCREPLSLSASSGHAHPFASRYDEPDAMVFFDDVVVPWDRVFLLYDSETAVRGLRGINAWSLYASQVRLHERIRTFVGITTMLAEAIGVHEFREVQERMGELISYAEIVRHGLRGMEADASLTASGLLAPGNDLALSSFAAQIAPRLIEIVRGIAASGIVMQPSEADLAEPRLRPFLDRYMRGHDIDAARKARLFRLAWDLAADSSGMRQDLYERWHRGDVVRNRINLYRRYDRSDVVDRISALIANPMPAPGVGS